MYYPCRSSVSHFAIVVHLVVSRSFVEILLLSMGWVNGSHTATPTQRLLFHLYTINILQHTGRTEHVTTFHPCSRLPDRLRYMDPICVACRVTDILSSLLLMLSKKQSLTLSSSRTFNWNASYVPMP